MVLSDKIKGNGHKLKHRTYCLNIRKHLFYYETFTVKVTKHWSKLSRKVVESPSLEIIKSCLETVRNNWL